MPVVAVTQGAVYPRVCGGTKSNPAPMRQSEGLSPRVRGNRGDELRGVFRRRSIPACAGEPEPPPPSNPALQVYPRVCGGTARPA